MAVQMSCRHKTVIIFGVAQILIGLAILGAGVANFLVNSWAANTFHGVWGGVWVLATGAVGVYGGFKKSRASELVFMVLNIVSAASVWLALAIISVWSLWIDQVYSSKLNNNIDTETCPKESLAWHGRQYDVYHCPNNMAAVANITILIASGLLLKSAIFSAAFACFAVCRCCGAGDHDNVVSPENHFGSVDLNADSLKHQDFAAPYLTSKQVSW